MSELIFKAKYFQRYFSLKLGHLFWDALYLFYHLNKIEQEASAEESNIYILWKSLISSSEILMTEDV